MGSHFANGHNFKLSSRQKEALYCNCLSLLVQTNMLDQAKEHASELSDSTTHILLHDIVPVRQIKKL